VRLLIVGLGSIGRRHLANMALVDPSAALSVWRMRADANDSPDGCRVVRTLADALAERPDAAIVACAASRHIEVAIPLAESGVHLLIEKPLSNATDGVERLLEVSRSTRSVLMVGYTLRFYPPLRAMQQAIAAGRIGRVLSVRAEVGEYLPAWRPTDYRSTVSARRALGGGAVLELSHEIDYVRWMVGEVARVTAMVGTLSDLEIDVEDTAEIVCGFENGAIGSLHLDMIQQPARRTCRVVGTGGVLAWDRATHEVRLVPSDGAAAETIHPAVELQANQMYIDELRHFLDTVRTGSEPIVSGRDGWRVLMIAEAVKQSAREGRTIALPS
jgi:predicted dehydrogenase